MLNSLAARAIRCRTILSDAMLPADWLTSADIAAQTGLSVRTLANWRCKKIGPAFVKFGKKVRYSRADYRAWRDRARIQTRKVN